jgi:hypothetical protein
VVSLHGALAVLCLAVGLLHLTRLVRRRRDIALEAGYAAMALGMAGMFSPIGDPVPEAAWVAVFLLAGVGFAAALARTGSEHPLRGEVRHLTVGSATMLFMLGADHRADTGAGGHAAHTPTAPGMVGIASAVALVLAAYFVMHVLRCADRLRAATVAAPAPIDGRRVGPVAVALAAPASERCSARTAAVAHLLMTAAMAVMLVDMI